MIPSIPRSSAAKFTYAAYIFVFFVYLFAPLIAVSVFAFNDSQFPSLPWRGFTLDWFLSSAGRTGVGRTGLFFDNGLMSSIGTSTKVAIIVTLISVTVGTTNAFLLERMNFRGRGILYVVMLWPLVIPGVILGVSILQFMSTIANGLEDFFNIRIDFMRPGLPLVIAGQFSFIATIATLIISARLRKFDIELEEAALNLGASHWMAIWTVTLPFLRPSMIGAGIISILMSFENFNTTLMLVGSDAPITIRVFTAMRDGVSPVINALSLVMMFAMATLAIGLMFTGGSKDQGK